MRKTCVWLLCLAVLLMALPGSAENAFRFDKDVNLVFEGETLQTILTRVGDTENGEVSYSSQNTKIATVDANGVVTGITKGKTNITAAVQTSSRTYRTQLSVTVARKAETVEVNTSKLPVYDPGDPFVAGLISATEYPVLVVPVKKTLNFQVTVTPRDATNKNVVLTSADDSVIRIRGTGITGLQAGETDLTIANVLSPEVSETFHVLVVQPVTRITANAPDSHVAVGGQMTLTASVQPENASIQDVIWSSTDERIATVDDQGVLTGVKRGNVRVVASAADGSGIRTNISVRVVQLPTSIEPDKSEITIDAGRTAFVRPTVMPKDADDKNVVWSSSDERIAKVNAQGRITGVSLGECVVTCTSKADSRVSANVTVHVQQPVTKLSFTGPIEVYVGETGKLEWVTEPANASNPAVILSSGNTKVLTVDQDGNVTGVKAGEAFVNAVTADGSQRKARVKVKVLQHVTGVHMKRSTAYLEVREGETLTGVLEPDNASNRNMVWTSDNPEIASAKGDKNKVRITGVAHGETRVVGVTEDGGYTTSIQVKIGNWDKSLSVRNFSWDPNYRFYISVDNVSDLTITKIYANIYFYTTDGDEPEPYAVNTRDGSNVIKAVWTGILNPGDGTGRGLWNMPDYKAPSDIYSTRGVVEVTSFQIDNDWIKTIRKNNRKSMEW